MRTLSKRGNIFKNDNIIGFQDFDANQNIELKYLEFLQRPEYYKIDNFHNYSFRNAWTSLGVWYKYVNNKYSDSHESNHKKLVKKLNEDL